MSNTPITRENYFQRVSQKILDQLATMNEEEKEKFIEADLKKRMIKREQQKNRRHRKIHEMNNNNNYHAPKNTNHNQDNMKYNDNSKNAETRPVEKEQNQNNDEHLNKPNSSENNINSSQQPVRRFQIQINVPQSIVSCNPNDQPKEEQNKLLTPDKIVTQHENTQNKSAPPNNDDKQKREKESNKFIYKNEENSNQTENSQKINLKQIIQNPQQNDKQQKSQKTEIKAEQIESKPQQSKIEKLNTQQNEAVIPQKIEKPQNQEENNQHPENNQIIPEPKVETPEQKSNNLVKHPKQWFTPGTATPSQNEARNDSNHQPQEKITESKPEPKTPPTAQQPPTKTISPSPVVNQNSKTETQKPNTQKPFDKPKNQSLNNDKFSYTPNNTSNKSQSQQQYSNDSKRHNSDNFVYAPSNHNSSQSQSHNNNTNKFKSNNNNSSNNNNNNHRNNNTSQLHNNRPNNTSANDAFVYKPKNNSNHNSTHYQKGSQQNQYNNRDETNHSRGGRGGNSQRGGRGSKRGGNSKFEWHRDPSPPPRFESSDPRVSHFKEGKIEPPLPTPVKRTLQPASLSDGDRLEKFRQLDAEFIALGQLKHPSKTELDQRVNFYESSIKTLIETHKASKEKYNNLQKEDFHKQKLIEELEVNHRNANIAIKTLCGKIDDKNHEISSLSFKLDNLKSEHSKMEREFGVTSIIARERAIESLKNKTEVDTTTRVELKKRLATINKMTRENERKYADMDKNEVLQEEVTESKRKAREELKELRDERTLMFSKRDQYEKELNEERKKIGTNDNEIKKLRVDIDAMEKEITEKKKIVVAIIEKFYKELDSFLEKNKRAQEIENQKAEIVNEKK